MKRASLGVANRGIKDSKNRRGGNNNNNNNNNLPQQPQYDTSLLEQVTKPSTGTGRFPAIKKVPTATRNASVNNVPPKPVKGKVPPALANYQPRGPQVNARPSAPKRGSAIPQNVVQPIDENQPFAEERNEDFNFGPRAKNPIQPNYDMEPVIRMPQQGVKKLIKPCPVTPLVRNTSRAIAKPIQKEEEVTEDESDDGMVTYKVNASMDPRRKSVTDAFVKYIEDFDEVSFLTIAKVITEFLKKSSQQQQHDTRQQQVPEDSQQQEDDQYEQGSDDYQNYDDQNDQQQEEMFETD